MSSMKESVEELKLAVGRLKNAVDVGDKGRARTILGEVEQLQRKFETQRKGMFLDDGMTEEDYRSAGVNNLLAMRSHEEKIVELQQANDDILLVSQLLNVHPVETKLYGRMSPKLKAAMNTGTSGSGSEWVPTGYSSRLFDKIRLEMMVGNLFEALPMPANIYKPPVVSSDATAYLIGENTGADDDLDTAKRIPSTSVGTASFTLTAKKLAGRIVFSEELNEDSITPILPLLTQNIVTALASAEEQALINGDTSATHMDSDVTAASDARKAWDGLRKLCPAGTKVDSSSFTGDAISSIRSKLGKYGVRPSDLALITSISAYNKLLNLKDTSGNSLVVTLDKYGPQATILTGELGKVYGIPVIVSEFVRQDLNASGVYDGTTTTKTEVILVNRKGFVRGDRRILKVKVSEIISTDQSILVATMRRAFSNVYAASETVCGIGYNILTA